nr:hypothetical protein [Tanacetum cinerariifolium]
MENPWKSSYGELKQSNGKDQAKAAKKWKTSGKEKPLAILMVQPWQRVAKQKITQTFSSESVISFPPLGDEDGTEGPMIIKAEMEDILFTACMWMEAPPQKSCDEEHSTSAWMNFMIVRSPSPYNGIIRRPRVRRIQAVSSTAHEMLKFLVAGRTVTLRKQTIAIASTLTEEGWKKLCGLLRRNLDIFSRKPVDMIGVPRHITEHSLNIRERCLPVRQKKRGQAPEQNKAIYEEAKKLVDAGIMKEVHYHSWLSNPVMVKKHDGNWRIPTYQPLVDKAFQKQIGQNLEVYVDDLVIKSRTEKEVIRDIEETFKTLREINMKLNPKKRTFGMREGMFLGYKVNADGLKVCPDKAFKQMKTLIAELPMLTASKEKEELVIYLAAAKEAISAVLMTKRDEKQMPIYFVSRALQGPRINKTPMEKLILALVAGRLLKWRFELEEHDIHYRPRTSVKGHILADFIIECPEDDPLDTPIKEKEELSNSWILFTDGSSCIDEYKALIAGLRIAEQMGVKNLQANVDFGLVANQVNETYVAKESGIFAHLSKQVLVKELKEKSINEREVLVVIEEEGRTWMTLIYEYLTKEILPEEKRKARAIRRKASRYVVTNGILYKRSFLGPWLQCVGPLQADYVLREIHERSCSMHAGPRSVMAKGLRSRFSLPREIISDNGNQFGDNPFKDWCEKLCIRQCFASIKHPQANGLVERAIRSLGEGIKAWLDERSKNWIEEISHVLWAHSTMIKSSNRETPFSLTYRTKAVIPVEIGMPTLRTAEVDMIKNDEALEINLDLLKEKREQATIQEAKSKVMMEKYSLGKNENSLTFLY